MTHPRLGEPYDPYRHSTQQSQSAAEVVIPPVVYLPVRRLPEGGFAAEVRETSDRQRALLVFTALDRLLDACGGSQLWVLVETTALDAIQDTQPFDLLAFDPELPREFVRDGRLV